MNLIIACLINVKHAIFFILNNIGMCYLTFGCHAGIHKT